MAQDAGIPDEWIKWPNVAYVKPNWEWARTWDVPWAGGMCTVYHGDRKKGALAYARLIGQSVVAGHHHSEFSLQVQNSRNRMFFGMDVGCLVDEESYAMRYAKTNPLGQVLGTGAIVDGWPRLFPMETDRKGRWKGKIV